MLISLVTGVLLALSWPARGFPFLAFFAFIPLFWVEDQVFILRKEIRTATFFFYCWLAFFLFNLFTTWWIMYATVPGMIVAVLLNSLFMAIPWWLMHVGRRIMPGSQGQLPVVFLWLAFEFLHGRWELSWSWLDLGNVFASYPAWVQWYQITGSPGGSFWILIINLLLFLAISNYFKAAPLHKKAISGALTALVIFIVPAVYSFHQWIVYDEAVNPVEVVVIQPSKDPYEPVRTQEKLEQHIDHMIALADKKITPFTRFVVAPEGANPQGIWMHEAERHYTVQRLRQHLDLHPGVTWVLGSFTYMLYGADEEVPATARPWRDSGRFYDVYNSAIMIEHGRDIQYYHKSKLVPGIERMPYFTVLKPLGRLVDRFGGIAGSLGTQDERSVFVTSDDGIRLAPAVCYESIYGDFMASYLQNGAELLFIITNDGWWRDTPGYRQHVQYARLRAIEMRRSIARSASTGISAFIGQRGEIISQTRWWEAGAIATTLNKNHTMTFYARTGNYIGKISLFLSILFLLFVLSQKHIRRAGSRQ